MDNPRFPYQELPSVPGDILQLGRQLLRKNPQFCTGQRLDAKADGRLDDGIDPPWMKQIAPPQPAPA